MGPQIETNRKKTDLQDLKKDRLPSKEIPTRNLQRGAQANHPGVLTQPANLLLRFLPKAGTNLLTNWQNWGLKVHL
jgi:hypothetical protein